MRTAADPSWQFLLVWVHGQQPSLVMFPRGGKVSSLIERAPQRLINMNDAATVEDVFIELSYLRPHARSSESPAGCNTILRISRFVHTIGLSSSPVALCLEIA